MNYSFRKINLFFVCTLIGFASCKRGPVAIPGDVIPPDSMIIIMADIHIAESRIIQAGTRSMQRNVKSEYMKQVLANAHVDTTRFLRSFDFYSENPEQFSEMYESVINEISKKQALQGRKQ